MRVLKSENINYLNLIPFSNFDKWYVSYYINPNNLKSTYPLVSLSKLIHPLKDKIKKSDYKGDIPVISKISFADGKIHLREKNETGMDLYKLNLGDLLVSKINFHQGALAINTISELVCSTHYQPYKINENLILPEYLVLVVRSTKFKNFLSYLRADGIKNEATYEFIGNLQIPLPSIKEQNKIVAAYQEKIQLAEQQAKQANELEAEIERYLLKELGVEKTESKPFKKGVLNLFNFTEIFDRWDFNKETNTVFSLLKKSKYPIKSLGESFNLINRSWDKKNYKEKVFRYVEMGAIDADLGIIEAKEVLFTKAPSRATQNIKKDDLIIGTTRPYLKKFAIVSEKYDDTVASSAFQLIEPSKNYCLEYLLEYIKSEFGVKQFENYMTGALYPAITSKDLRKILVPFPPVAKQLEISKHINLIKTQIKELNSFSLSNKEKAIKEFENIIFS